MGRLLLLLFVLATAPTAIWFAVRWVRRLRRSPGEEAPAIFENWQEAPWTWLILIGMVLAVLGVLAFGIIDQGDCIPVPTQMIDGRLVPAHCK
mgnify:CR=1 FL=1